MKSKSTLVAQKIRLSLILTVCLFSFSSLPAEQIEILDLPPAREYRYYAGSSATLPGSSAEKGQPASCDGKLDSADRIGQLAIFLAEYQKNCWKDPRFSSHAYKVEQGVVQAGDHKLPAYHIYPAAKPATKFIASTHYAHFQFESRQAYNIYQFKDGHFEMLAQIPANQIKPVGWTRIKDLPLSRLSESVIYTFAPARQAIGPLHSLAQDVSGARLAELESGRLHQIRYSGLKSLTASLSSSFQASTRRVLFPLDLGGPAPAVLYQQKHNGGIKLFKINSNLREMNTLSLPAAHGFILAAAASDQKHIYYLMVQKSARTKTARLTTLYKVNLTGKKVAQVNLSAARKDLNMVSYDHFGASMIAGPQHLSLILPRTMHKASDGLNHQGAIAVLFNKENLRIVRNWGQTSGHSFDNLQAGFADDSFYALDLGDNYPRGIHLHRWNETRRHSKIVYTFKTLHGSSPMSPARRRYPLYKEISKGGARFYKWSNDNGVYTELGGLLLQDGALGIAFTGEPYQGRSLNNARVSARSYGHYDARNVGFIKVRRDFEKASSRGNVVSDDLVLSKGQAEVGGFFDFGGRWSKQRNAGVIWLTNYQAREKENATRLRAVRIDEERSLLAWERWSAKAYLDTQLMVIDNAGEIQWQSAVSGQALRLARRDEIVFKDGRVFFFNTDPVAGAINMLVLELE